MAAYKYSSSHKNGKFSKKVKRDARYVGRGVGRGLKSIGKGVFSGLLDIFFFRR